MSIMGAINDSRVFGKHFEDDPGSWHAWFTFLRAVFGEPMDEDDLETFRECTQRQEPRGPYKQVTLCCGRRGGKSYIMALIAVYLAAFRDYKPYLAAGERAVIAVVCPDRDQARHLLDFIEGMFSESKVLAQLIERQTQDSFELSTRVTISVMTASHRTIRGYGLACAIIDECAFLPGDENALPASEILRAVKPALGSFADIMLIIASSPKGKVGILWDAVVKHFGKENSRNLVWKASTLYMHPTYNAELIKSELEDDPAGAYAEYYAEFRDDVGACFDPEIVRGSVDTGVFERPYIASKNYMAFCDTSSGRSDSFTMAIGHLEKDGDIERAVVDLLYEARPPFNPEITTREVCDILPRYGVHKVIGDNYAAGWVAAAFERNHITYEKSEKVVSDIYLSSVRHFNSGLVSLPDNRRLVSQICALERRQAQSGRERVIHPLSGHDDLANSALGVIDLCLSQTSGQVWDDFGDNVHLLQERLYGLHAYVS